MNPPAKAVATVLAGHEAVIIKGKCCYYYAAPCAPRPAPFFPPVTVNFAFVHSFAHYDLAYFDTKAATRVLPHEISQTAPKSVQILLYI